MSVVPYKARAGSKKQQVAEMFDNISPKYDFLNHFLSLGIDIVWRKKAINFIAPYKPKYLLDVATGTADLALEAMTLNPDKIIGIDISEGMLSLGRKKITKKALDQRISLESGDSEQLRFHDAEFDAVMASFGVRNFENLPLGLAEMHRVLKPGGVLMVLEFSQPEKFPFKQLYNLYFNKVLPSVGKVFSKDNSAYTYLPESVQVFPYGKAFIEILNNLGFKNTKCYPLTLGISSIYIAEK